MSNITIRRANLQEVAAKKIGLREYRALLAQFVILAQETLADNLVTIVLYGSVARGDARPESDVDLLLVLEQASPVYCERLQVLHPILRRLRQRPCWQELVACRLAPELNVLIFSRAEAERNRHLYLDMIEDALLLVDRGDFFEQRLQTLRRRLAELGAAKVRRNGTWYWDLKPDLKLGETVAL